MSKKGLLKLFVASCMIALPLATWGFVRGNELINIPTSKMEKQGFIEIGAGSQVSQSGSLQTSSSIFMRWALSNQVEYGITDQDNKMLHHFQFAFTPIGTDSKMSCWSFGIKNVGYTPSTNKVTSTQYGVFTTYSFQLVDYGALFHIGAGEDLSTHRINGYAGIELNSFLGTLIGEWDGSVYNLGIKNVFDDQVKLTLALQVRQKELEPGEVPSTFKIALSFMDVYSPIKTQDSVPRRYRKQLEDDYEKPKPLEPKLPTPSVQPSASVKEKYPTLSVKAAVPTLSAGVSATHNISTASVQQKLPTQNLKIADPVILTKSITLMQQGMRYYYQGQYLEALSQYQEFVKLNPNLAIGYTSLGSIYLQLGLPNDAIKQWQKALELEPDNPQIKVFLNQLLNLKKEP